MSSPLAIDVADLSKKYGQRMALSHANFEVPMGSICGFVGHGTIPAISPPRRWLRVLLLWWRQNATRPRLQSASTLAQIVTVD